MITNLKFIPGFEPHKRRETEEEFLIPGGYDEKEAKIKELLSMGYIIPPRICYQTCIFGYGYYVTLIPPTSKVEIMTE